MCGPSALYSHRFWVQLPGHTSIVSTFSSASMLNFNIGSPSGRRPLQTAVHTPFTYHRRPGPLFPPTPANRFATPIAVGNVSFPHGATLSAFSNATPSYLRNSSPQELRVDIADGKSYTLFSFIEQYGGTFQHPPQQWANTTSAITNDTAELQLPWVNSNFKGPSTLFRQNPPKLNYPTGSIDENVNLHFVRSALGFLRSSTYVRDVIDWDPRPHPFYFHQPLIDLAHRCGFPDFQFDASKTLSTLEWVESVSPTMAARLHAIYNFGDVVSYSNINERIYHIVYGWLNHKTIGGDIHLLTGVDAGTAAPNSCVGLRQILVCGSSKFLCEAAANFCVGLVHCTG